MYILVTGASGSGTSTLGKALAKNLNAAFFDTDDFFWLPTDPPYTERRPANERLTLILNRLGANERAIVAGSVIGWGSDIERAFDLVVFVYLDTVIRLRRLYERELERHGSVNSAFIDWAAQYDSGPSEGRSLTGDTVWFESLRCKVVHVGGDLSLSDRLSLLAPHL